MKQKIYIIILCKDDFNSSIDCGLKGVKLEAWI